MSGWNGSGGFTLPFSWVADAAAGIDISSTRMDTQFSTISVAGFNNTLTRDGQGAASANLPMNGHRHTGAGPAVDTTDYVIKLQITGGSLAGSFTTLAASSTVTLSPATANVAISPTAGTLTIAPASGTMNKVVIGGTTPAAGSFTTLIATNDGTIGDQVVNFGQFPVTPGATGSSGLPNGLLEKWGTSATVNGFVNVAFGAAFPNACDNVQLTISGGVAPVTLHPVLLGTVNANGFNVYGDAGESLTFHWRALGR